MKTYLLVMTTTNVVDLVTTVHLANKIGWQYEGNPVVRWYVQRFGVWPASVFKIVSVLLLATLLWQLCKRARVIWVAWLVALVFAFIAAFNTGGVIALHYY